MKTFSISLIATLSLISSLSFAAPSVAPMTSSVQGAVIQVRSSKVKAAVALDELAKELARSEETRNSERLSR